MSELTRRLQVRPDQRGAALILEIIIYLVIVALIAVAVISSVKAIRNLVYTSHARGDVLNVQSWAEGKFTQDGKYPNYYSSAIDDPKLVLTTTNGVTNEAWISSVDGANAGYCIRVGANSMNDGSKRWFYLSSANASRIMQTGTGTANGAVADGTRPPSDIPGLTCP